MKALWKHCKAHGANIPFAGSVSVEPIDYSGRWLTKELEQLTILRQRANSMLSSFRYGIIYAIRFIETDVRFLTYSNTAGLAAHCQISSERFVAKAIIPREFQLRRREDPLRSSRSKAGIIAAVKEYQGKNRSEPGGLS